MKLIGYIIKGFLINLKRGWDKFHKDIQAFIDNRVNGVVAKPKQNKNKKNNEEETKKLLKLISNTGDFNEFLNQNALSQKFLQTLKKISIIKLIRQKTWKN